MLVIFGYGSKIAEAVRAEIEGPVGATRSVEDFQAALMDEPPTDADRYLFCAGVLIGKALAEMRNDEAVSMMDVNFVAVARACEAILTANERARICVVGSESGECGSFDRIYAGSKAALHQYVETRLVGRHQQLVCVSPGIIEDAGMTIRREDKNNLAMRRLSHPKGRFLTSAEVARLIVFALYESTEYLTNTVIRIHGGDHIR